ncbi:hypothetical protein RJP21_05005 [Paenibacillus sp. VCA1]|uniref:hypothetical protein n=1 Tax=Paenibacillus sp. VCA1 TaxID=3039148 RepID=UPI0028711225|nr:hypothetical protein [Paenibacillus sp. VCA1]MDR9852958.1 hypothetical protein [Paenibacillus sp. VCA1]
MRLRKFPITAPSGRQYEVTIERNYVCLGAYGLEFRVYRHEIRKQLFGRTRLACILVREESYWETDVEDVIPIVQKLIRDVEAQITRKEAREASYVAFTAWDGKITEEVST